MDSREVAKYWGGNAERWTKLVRMGCDVYRECVLGPPFLEILGDVRGFNGLDVGCGEGYSTRLAAKKGAVMTGVDVSEVFVRHAKEAEEQERLGITYTVGDATRLAFEDGGFDFVMAMMSLMDVQKPEEAIREAHRVLKRGGFFQFAISHPCFATPKWEWICDQEGRREALKCGDYFRELDGDVEKWMFSATPKELRTEMGQFQVPRFTMILSRWLNLLVDAGFVLERFGEPAADDEALRKWPVLADSRQVAYFLIVRSRKI